MLFLSISGVAAMLALYSVIIAGCLRQPEW